MDILYFIFLFVVILHINLTNGFTEVTEHTTKKFVLNVAMEDFEIVNKEVLQIEDVVFLKEIIPEHYIYEDGNYDGQTDTIADVIADTDVLKFKVKHYERVKSYTIDEDDRPTEAADFSSNFQTSDSTLKHCPTFSDMGVESVWEAGFTGKGVVVAITDVGINTDILDLHCNIRLDLSHNVVTDSTDITPETCQSDYASSLPDHGNNCAGVVGAIRNTVCGDGIIFNAQFVGIKIFKIRQSPGRYTCGITFDWTWIAQGLLHAFDQVDIYSNSWGYTKDFVSHSQLVNDALQQGVSKGRSGKGATYVFPVGNLSDPFTNSIHTIAVNSIGCSGSASSFSAICACTLTSAYGEACSTGTQVLLTTSYEKPRQCKTDFKGTSAATAIVAGIIGLALQANPQLTWRDIQHLVVEASDSTHLPEHENFQTNGANKKYHSVLGYGLLNATTLVRLAQASTGIPEQLEVKGRCTMPASRQYLNQHPYYYYEETKAETSSNTHYVNLTESVLITISYESPSEHFTELILTSPRGTVSILMNRNQSTMKEPTTRTDAVFKSVHFWGEDANGQWVVTMKQTNGQNNFRLISCELAIYGTGNAYIDPHKDSETSQSASDIDSSEKVSTGVIIGIVVGTFFLFVIVPLCLYVYTVYVSKVAIK